MKLTMRETMSAFQRAPLLSALSITTIAFSLFAFGLFGLVAVNIREALQQVEERVEIRAFVASDTPTEIVAITASEIAKFPEIARADVISQEAALEKAKRELGEFRDVFEKASFLPASIEVRLKPGYRDPATVRRVAERLRTYEFVDDIRYGEEWIVQLYRLRNIAGATGLVLGLAFAAVAVIIIGTTIRMAVLARSREISIMRLVGATDSFVRRPFLIEGFAKGILGGLLALLLTWMAMQLIQRYLNFDTIFFDGRLAVLGVLFGALIGLMGSAISVGRHLRKI
jgi:cell division transport system permease protein